MNNIYKKIWRYVDDILDLDQSGSVLHIVLVDNNVDDSDLYFCLSLIGNQGKQGKLGLIDTMCKHCTELLMNLPIEKRLYAIYSEDEYIFLNGDAVYSKKFNSYGLVMKNSDDSNDDLYVKFEITDHSKETQLMEDLMLDNGTIAVYDDEICLV